MNRAIQHGHDNVAQLLLTHKVKHEVKSKGLLSMPPPLLAGADS